MSKKSKFFKKNIDFIYFSEILSVIIYISKNYIMLPWRFILSINKFSKYGIVLVAAITLATAVQTQFGQSSTKVYAEETASDANYNDWRMFYVYSADYPDKPDSGSMSGRVIKPSEPYVVDENFRNPGTYSHYDVFDDTGKHYNVGDIITVNDPLVNHKNEEDNRLYYYYYPLNSDNTSEAPANSTTPATSEAPAVSTTPATSENPISDNDPSLNRMLYLNYSASDDPTISWLTGNVVTPKGYTVMPGDELEGYPYYTITGSNGKKYSVGDIITTEEPGLFGHANYEDDALYYRYYRTNPNSVSEAPAVSTTPATSEAPAVSTTPATSEAPAVSTTPATSLVPSKNIHSMNSVTYSSTQTRNAGIKSEADGKLTSHDLPKTGDTNSKVGMLGMIFVGLGLTSFVYKGRHRRS